MQDNQVEDAVVISPSSNKLADILQTVKLLKSNLQVAQGALILMGANPSCGITSDMIKDSISLVIYELDSKILT